MYLLISFLPILLQDAAQTTMWASVFPSTALNLAYSYSTCSQCQRRSQTECLGHTLCVWNTATSLCADKPPADPTLSEAAKNCKSKNSDTCGGVLNKNCVFSPTTLHTDTGGFGMCLVASQSVREAGWQCPLRRAGDARCKCLSPTDLGFIPKSALSSSNKLAYDRTISGGPNAGQVVSHQMPGDYGSRCLRWDHPDTLGFDFYGSGDPSSCGGDIANLPEHCNKEWCYVDPCSCDIGVLAQTSMWTTQYPTAEGLAYSFAACALCEDRPTQTECTSSLSCEWSTESSFCMPRIAADVAERDCAARAEGACGGATNKNCAWNAGAGACELRPAKEIKAAFGCGYLFQTPSTASPPNAKVKDDFDPIFLKKTGPFEDLEFVVC